MDIVLFEADDVGEIDFIYFTTEQWDIQTPFQQKVVMFFSPTDISTVYLEAAWVTVLAAE
jgi:hypothetical protein